jgi:hypothetical protein
MSALSSKFLNTLPANHGVIAMQHQPCCVLLCCRGEVLAFKAIQASSTGATSVKGKALSANIYTIWWEESTAIGTPSDPISPTPAKLKACLDACEGDQECAAVGMTKVAPAATPEATLEVSIGSCRLIKGVSVVGANKRSLTRVDLNRMTLSTVPPPPSEFTLHKQLDSGAFDETQRNAARL